MSRSLFIKLGFDLKAFSKSSQNIARSLKKTGKQMKNIGKSMTMSLTAPIVAMGGLAVKVFADFEQSMAKVQAVSGATGAEFQKLNTLAKDLGISTRFTASQVADLQLNYAKLGFSSEEIEKITESTLNLALASGSDLAESATVAASTLNALGLEASAMPHLIDVMANSFASSGLDLDKFKESMKLVAPAAKATGRSVEKVTGMLSVMADGGISGSLAGTQLSRVFIELNKNGLSLSDAMSTVAKSSDKLGVATDLVGDRGAKALLIMSENRDSMAELTTSYETQIGVAAEMAAIMDDTTTGSLMKLKSATEGLAISFGEVLSPFIKKAAAFVSDLAIRFSELSPQTKKIIVTVAALVAAIGPLIFIIGSLTVALGFLAANPIVLIITGIIVAIGLLAAAFVYVRNNAEQFADFFYNLWVGIANTTIESIKNIIAPFLYLTNLMGMPIEGGVNGYLDTFKLTARTAKKEFQTLGEAIEQTKGQIKDALDIDDETDSFVANNKKIVASTLEVSRSWKGLGEILSSMKIEKEFNPNVRIDLSNVKIDVSTLPDILTEAQEIGIQISDALVSGLERMVVQSAQLMGEFVGNMLTGSDKVARQDFGKAFLGMIGGFMQEFGAAMVGIGIAQIGIQAAIASMNPALAIAGGVALIAAGAVLSNVSKKGLDSSGGGGGGGIDAAPAPSYSGGGQDYSMSTGVRISGRDLILVQERERTFRR
jgi:hypothetical protein